MQLYDFPCLWISRCPLVTPPREVLGRCNILQKLKRSCIGGCYRDGSISMINRPSKTHLMPLSVMSGLSTNVRDHGPYICRCTSPLDCLSWFFHLQPHWIHFFSHRDVVINLSLYIVEMSRIYFRILQRRGCMYINVSSSRQRRESWVLKVEPLLQ